MSDKHHMSESSALTTKKVQYLHVKICDNFQWALSLAFPNSQISLVDFHWRAVWIESKKPYFCESVASPKNPCRITVATMIPQDFLSPSLWNQKWVFSGDLTHHDFFSTVMNQTQLENCWCGGSYNIFIGAFPPSKQAPSDFTQMEKEKRKESIAS